MRGRMRGSKTMPFTRVRSSVTPAAGVNSPAESVVGIASCGSGAAPSRTGAQRDDLGGVDHAAAAEGDDRVGAGQARGVGRGRDRVGGHVLAAAREAARPERAEARLERAQRGRALVEAARAEHERARAPIRRSSSGTCASAPAPREHALRNQIGEAAHAGFYRAGGARAPSLRSGRPRGSRATRSSGSRSRSRPTTFKPTSSTCSRSARQSRGRDRAREPAPAPVGPRGDAAQRRDARARGHDVHARDAHQPPRLAHAEPRTELEHVRLEEAAVALLGQVRVVRVERAQLVEVLEAQPLDSRGLGDGEPRRRLERHLQELAVRVDFELGRELRREPDAERREHALRKRRPSQRSSSARIAASSAGDTA